MRGIAYISYSYVEFAVQKNREFSVSVTEGSSSDSTVKSGIIRFYSGK